MSCKMESQIIELKNYCRICSSINENLTSLESLCNSEKMEQLFEFLNIKVTNETFPNGVCNYCTDQLKHTLEFREKCELSYHLFENMIAENSRLLLETENMKNEIADVHFSDDESNHLFTWNSSMFEGIFESEETKTKIKGKQQCKVCSKKFNRKDQLLMHQLDEHGIPYEEKIKPLKIEDYKCKYCEKTFKSKYPLQKHINNIHENPESSYKFLCSLCGRAFRYMGDLKTHIKFKHSDVRDIQCEYCDKRFKTKSYYRRHERNVHLNQRNFKCEFCTKAFNSKELLTNHTRTHTGEKPFVCSICSKAFSHDATLYKHKKLVHGNSFNSRNFL